MDSDLDLSGLRAFRAVVREGSFAAAALSLRAPKSTLSKRVADLERHLGVRLIERTTRQLRVTDEGHILAARADRLLGDAEDIRRALGESGSAPRGHLRISVPTVLGNLLIGSIAASFAAAYPEITLEIHFLDRAPDLLEEGFDGAVRFGPIEDSGQIARRLMEVRGVLVAAPGLARIAELAAPSQLADYPSVGLCTTWAGSWSLLRQGELAQQIALRPQLLLGSMLAVRDAVVAGAGVSMLPALLAQQEFAMGRLLHVLPGWETPRKSMLFVYPSAQSMTHRLRVFIDHLMRELQANIAPNP